MTWLLALPALAATPADAPGPDAIHPLHTEVVRLDEVLPPPPSGGPMPPPEDVHYGLLEVQGLLVARPQGAALQNGYDYTALDDTVEAALAGRETPYDFVVVFHTNRLPTRFSGSAAFHLSYNNTDHDGIGIHRAISPDMPTRAVLWMNSLSSWEYWGEANHRWVFGQEFGHYWLSFARVGESRDRVLLGRDSAHWSYFMNAGNSPMEGNAWIDNGDGTFTTDNAAGAGPFNPLDMYLMGFIGPEEVPPFWVIEPEGDVPRSASSSPEFLWSSNPLTISGTRVEYTVDDVIDAHGERLPIASEAQRDFRLLPVLVLSPTEPLTTEVLDLAHSRLSAWSEAWFEQTGGLSSVTFEVVDEGGTPPLDIVPPALVPRGAW